MQENAVLVVFQIVLADVGGKAVVGVGVAAADREGFIVVGFILAAAQFDVNIALGADLRPVADLPVEDEGLAVIHEGTVLFRIAPPRHGGAFHPRGVHDGRGIEHVGQVSLGDLHHRNVVIPGLRRVQIVGRRLRRAGIPRLGKGIGIDGYKRVEEGVPVTDDIVIPSLTSSLKDLSLSWPTSVTKAIS